MHHDTSARLLEIDRLFAQALELSGRARQAWLRDLAARDAEAAVHVEELLRAAETPTAAAFDGRLASIVSTLAAAAAAAIGNRGDDHADDHADGRINGRGDDRIDERSDDHTGAHERSHR